MARQKFLIIPKTQSLPSIVIHLFRGQSLHYRFNTWIWSLLWATLLQEEKFLFIGAALALKEEPLAILLSAEAMISLPQALLYADTIENDLSILTLTLKSSLILAKKRLIRFFSVLPPKWASLMKDL